MVILGIETSCDETAAAVLQKQGNRITILSNVVASSASLQAKYGGIIPEQAAREQIKSIIPVIAEAIEQAFPNVIPANAGIQLTKSGSELDPRLRGDDRIKNIDAIAVTYGPGLIGSLLVGVETAKVLATIWQKPLIPVNHLIGHFYANWIADATPKFPCIGLLVSGGHTDLVLFTDHGKYKYLGGTRDDAAGECFDKCARLLGLPYPGGPEIARLAQTGDPTIYKLPSPLIDSKDFDFSFSGLKTAVSNLFRSDKTLVQATEVQPVADSHLIRAKRFERPDQAHEGALADLAASIEQAIINVLVEKTVRAVQTYNIPQVMVAGGVAANQALSSMLRKKISRVPVFTRSVALLIPPPALCTDNGAMIASAAFFEKPLKNPLDLQADPNLSLYNH